MTPELLKAIRSRAQERPTVGLAVQHGQAVADRRALLEYVDALEAEIAGIGQSVAEILGTIRLQLASQLVRDGHAKDLREGLAIARDPVRSAALYPAIDA